MPGLGSRGESCARTEATAEALEVAITHAALDTPALFDGVNDKQWDQFLKNSWRELREGRTAYRPDEGAERG